MCETCGLPLTYRKVQIKRAWWMTPACHIESVDAEGNRTVNGKVFRAKIPTTERGK